MSVYINDWVLITIILSETEALKEIRFVTAQKVYIPFKTGLQFL